MGGRGRSERIYNGTKLRTTVYGGGWEGPTGAGGRRMVCM